MFLYFFINSTTLRCLECVTRSISGSDHDALFGLSSGLRQMASTHQRQRLQRAYNGVSVKGPINPIRFIINSLFRGEERLHVRSISGGDHDSLFGLTSGLRAQGGRELTVTGVGCKQYSKELQKGLDVKYGI